MPRQQTAKDIQAAAGCDGDHDAERVVRVPGCIGAGRGGAKRGRGKKGGTEQQIAAEGHGVEIQVCWKYFSLKSRKTSIKKILFFKQTLAKDFQTVRRWEDYSPLRGKTALKRAASGFSFKPHRRRFHPSVKCSIHRERKAAQLGFEPWRKSISLKT
jgi:hypothetical protein